MIIICIQLTIQNTVAQCLYSRDITEYTSDYLDQLIFEALTEVASLNRDQKPQISLLFTAQNELNTQQKERLFNYNLKNQKIQFRNIEESPTVYQVAKNIETKYLNFKYVIRNQNINIPLLSIDKPFIEGFDLLMRTIREVPDLKND